MAELCYQTLIDAPTWAFVAATAAAYPDDTASRPIAEQRAIYDAMCARFNSPCPAGVTVSDRQIAGVPCRIYSGATPAVIYYHGGGFVVGGLDSHDAICADLAAMTGLQVVSVDYRLSPEHLHPAAFDDALAVARALTVTGTARGPVLLAGDSAGGNLAAAVSHRLRDSPGAVLGQVLIYPGLGGPTDSDSCLRHARAPMLSRDDVLFYRDIRHAGPAPQGDATAAPLQDVDFTRLPPTLAISAECDPLADDARLYVAALSAAGSPAQWVQEPGLVHGYLRARHTVPRAAAGFARIAATLCAFAKGDTP